MSTFLTPDKIITAMVGASVITIKQKITPDEARATKDICSYVKKGDLVKPNSKLDNGSGKPRGITVHNTDNITVPAGTTPAEQYARATYPNGNMGGAAVHFWVYKSDIWQQLADNERGWHAADGSTRRASQRPGQTIGGNLDTIAIEVIETGTDAETENTAAMLVAYLLDKHGLTPEYDVYTHNFFYSAKYCPAYILPHWNAFKKKAMQYYKAIQDAKNKTPALGDVNGDGKINALDAALILQHDAGLIKLTPEQLSRADVNGDGKVNSIDATLIMQYDAGIIKTFPASNNTKTEAPPTPSSTTLKSLDEIANEVINGKWVAGQDRINRLTAAGYDAKAVQARVNQLLK